MVFRFFWLHRQIKITESSKTEKIYPSIVGCVASSGEVDLVEKKKRKNSGPVTSLRHDFPSDSASTKHRFKKFSLSRIFSNKSTKMTNDS